MRLLVTGGCGFIGSNYIRNRLQEHPEDTITNLDKLTYAGRKENLAGLDERYRLVHGDILDADLVADLVRSVDTVVHFAAESHVDRSISDPLAFIRTNVEGTLVLLEAVRRHKKRFHHVSTDEVFGQLSLDDPPFDENSPYAPRSPYAASKAASDHLVRAHVQTHGIEATISNCSNNYGPFQFPEKVIPLFVTNLLDGKKVPLYGDGRNVRDWIHVLDHVRGIDAILEKGRSGETYCLGAGTELSNEELTFRILDALGHGEEMIERVPDRKGHDFRYALDSSKARRELDWKPRIDFSQGLAQTIEWYQCNEDWWRRIK